MGLGVQICSRHCQSGADQHIRRADPLITEWPVGSAPGHIDRTYELTGVAGTSVTEIIRIRRTSMIIIIRNMLFTNGY